MQILKGMPVVRELMDRLSADITELDRRGVRPKLAIVRVGEKEDDLSYEKAIVRRFDAAKAVTEVFALPRDVSQQGLEERIGALNRDGSVHGILLFRPLPKSLCVQRIQALIAPEKDVDCMGTLNTAYLFAADPAGYPPCTPQAVVELLDHYGLELTGRQAVIVGRSPVVGKPLALMLLARNATVTVCHTKTVDLAAQCRRADILVACAGAAGMITADFINPDQIVIDVGINVVKGALCGDVDVESVAGRVKALTPVPGGVGTITASVLLKHTVRSAMGS